MFRLLLLHNFRSVVDVRGCDWLFSEEKSFPPGFGYSNSGQKQRFQNFCPYSTEKTRQAHGISATSTYTIIVFGETIVKSYVKTTERKLCGHQPQPLHLGGMDTFQSWAYFWSVALDRSSSRKKFRNCSIMEWVMTVCFSGMVVPPKM